MKTKALLLAGLVSLAGIAASQAQTVYSVNAVGFVNVSVPTGFSLISNPLSSADMTVSALIPSAPNNTKIFKFNPSTGSYEISTYRTSLTAWTVPGMVLSPGEGAFIQNPTASAISLTFTGEVLQGGAGNPLVVALPAGFSIASSKVPQTGQLDTVLGFPIGNNDKIYKFSNAANNWEIYTYRNGAWLGGNAPTIGVAESFFAQKASAATWSRQFSVTN